MSITIDIDKLADEMLRYGAAAYVLTSAADGRPHITHVPLDLVDGTLRCDAGKRTVENVRNRDKVAVLWPPYEPGGFSLIVDADATVSDTGLVLTPTRAVQHRPAPGAGQVIGNDCRPLTKDQ